MLRSGCGAPRYRTVTSNLWPASIVVAAVIVSFRADWETFRGLTPSTVTRSTLSPSKSRLNRSSRIDATAMMVAIPRNWFVATR